MSAGGIVFTNRNIGTSFDLLPEGIGLGFDAKELDADTQKLSVFNENGI